MRARQLIEALTSDDGGIIGLLTSPDNRGKSYDEVMRAFKDRGGVELGRGSNGTVYTHPSWNYVAKVFHNDSPYLQFVRFAYRNPRPSYPKFYDVPRKVRVTYDEPKGADTVYVVRTEPLQHIDNATFEELDFYRYYGRTDWSAQPRNEIWAETAKKCQQLEHKYPHVRQFLDDYEFTRKHIGINDFTRNNIMQRATGEFVLSDPVWEGETPYQTYDRLLRSEVGDHDDEYDAAPLRRLGTRARRRMKNPKPKATRADDDDGVPF